MKIKQRVTLVVIIVLGLFTCFYGCSKDKVQELEKEKLFTIPIGSEEEEIGVVKENNGRFLGPSSALFKNGFFYIVDPVNSKILKITTLGDVILVLSQGNEEENQEENILRTKQRKYFNFNNIGKIAVDNENNIYVEDKFIQKLPEKNEIDLFNTESPFEQENGEMYVSYILKFDRLGKFLCRIGKDGRNTDPFYYVYKTEVDKDGNLIVLTADDDWQNWSYYKFDFEGNLLFNSTTSTDKVFDIKDMGDTSFFVMDATPACNDNHLIYWISLYNTGYDTKNVKKEEDLWGEEIEIQDAEKLKDIEEKGKKYYSRDLLHYKLLYYNLESNEVTRSYKWENHLGDTFEPTEEFFGIDGEMNSFLWKYLNNTKAIISIIRPNGALITRRSFVFEDNGLWTNIQVAIDGSVSALKIDNELLHFYRWRSDKLITNKREKVTLKEFFKDKIQEFKNANR